MDVKGGLRMGNLCKDKVYIHEGHYNLSSLGAVNMLPGDRNGLPDAFILQDALGGLIYGRYSFF